MSETTRSNNDPSMDDILASIRKIISDDEARAQVSGDQGGVAAATRPVDAGPADARPAAARGKRDDVLLLTDLVEEPKGGPMPTPLPLPRIDPASAADMPQPIVGAPVGDPAADQSLVAAGVAGVAASAFERLNQAVQASVPAPAAPDPGPKLGNGKTLEDLVKEMLRPMLKEWLDRNLPPMVERFVEREIVRLTRR
jgi:cell pole-organizing protein PopZ